MAAVDTFSGYTASAAGPKNNAAAVTPSDTVDLSDVTTGLWVGGAGNVVVIMNGGQTVTFTGVPAGTLLPIRVSRVKATSTTATNMIALW